MHNSDSGFAEERNEVCKDGSVDRRQTAQSDAKIYLHMDSGESEETQIDLVNIAGHMNKKKRLYRYAMAIALCTGILLGLIVIGVDYIVGQSTYARAVITLQYEGIENGLDPNGAAFDINKIKSPKVIEDALMSLGTTEFDSEKIRESIDIEGVVPEDAVERITVIKEMSLEDVSNYEKILDISYFPSQYIVYLRKNPGMSGKDAVKVLNAILDSYREYFMDTYANTEVLTVTGNLIDYKDYDYAEAMDMLETQMEIMQGYVSERRDQAPEFRSSGTGLSFGDISMALDTIAEIDIANLNSYIESHTLTKDVSRQREYYEYRIKKYNMDIAECQLELTNIQSVIDKYQKDPLVIVSSQESTQEIEQTNEYYDKLLQERLELSTEIASLNTKLNETYTLLNAVNGTVGQNTQGEYDYVEGKMSSVAETIAKWADLTEQTAQEYYTTTLFSNAYKIAVPAQYTAAGGFFAAVKRLVIPVAVLMFVVFGVWCVDGFFCELMKMKEDRQRNEK
ncbi:MAG: hypothetical protein HFH76_16965 [Lachnospiraceae bacterium]|nr:hypothetical protein [Lachnospiraceae bacterium]